MTMSYLGRAKSNLKILDSLKMLIVRIKLLLKKDKKDIMTYIRIPK